MQKRQPPYPADTRAKGWRFEVNMEQVEQSETWLRARNGITRGALLLLWHKAWMQTPCGSLPNSDELIALLLDMEDEEFQSRKKVLMRGWWLADDGRLYHDTITERVLAMAAVKDAERTRKAAYRARMSHGTLDLSHGTDGGQTRPSHGSDPGRDATGTRTGTSNTPIPPDGGMPPLTLPHAPLYPDGAMPPVPQHVLPLGGEPDAPPPARKAKATTPKAGDVEDVTPDAIAAWLQVRTKKKAGPMSRFVLDHLDREREKAGLTRQEAVEECIALGWQNFTAEWYLSRNKGTAPRRTATSHVGVDRENYRDGLDEHGNIL